MYTVLKFHIFHSTSYFLISSIEQMSGTALSKLYFFRYEVLLFQNNFNIWVFWSFRTRKSWYFRTILHLSSDIFQNMEVLIFQNYFSFEFRSSDIPELFFHLSSDVFQNIIILLGLLLLSNSTKFYSSMCASASTYSICPCLKFSSPSMSS